MFVKGKKEVQGDECYYMKYLILLSFLNELFGIVNWIRQHLTGIHWYWYTSALPTCTLIKRRTTPSGVKMKFHNFMLSWNKFISKHDHF